MAASPPLDLLLIARYALFVSLLRLLPIPVLDWYLESVLRRRLTRLQVAAFEVTPTRKEIGVLASADAGGCLGLLWSVLSWPFKRLLWYLLWVLLIKAMIDTFSDVVARAILVHEAGELGLLEYPALDVRAAIQRASRRANTRPIDRAVGIVFRSLWGQLLRRHGVETFSEAMARALWLPEVHDQLKDQLRREAQRGIALLPDPGEE